MNHLDFLVWMLGYPLVVALCEAIHWSWCKREDYSEGVEAMGALTVFVIWLAIGKALW